MKNRLTTIRKWIIEYIKWGGKDWVFQVTKLAGSIYLFWGFSLIIPSLLEALIEFLKLIAVMAFFWLVYFLIRNHKTLFGIFLRMNTKREMTRILQDVRICVYVGLQTVAREFHFSIPPQIEDLPFVRTNNDSIIFTIHTSLLKRDELMDRKYEVFIFLQNELDKLAIYKRHIVVSSISEGARTSTNITLVLASDSEYQNIIKRWQPQPYVEKEIFDLDF